MCDFDGIQTVAQNVVSHSVTLFVCKLNAFENVWHNVINKS